MRAHGRRAFLASLGVGSVSVAGCLDAARTDDATARTDGGTDRDASSETGESETTESGDSAGTVDVADDSPQGYPHVRASGNRVVAGEVDLSTAVEHRVEFDARPAWVVGLPSLDGDASVWAVRLEDGTVEGVRVDDAVSRVSVSPDRLDGTLPVAAEARAGELSLLTHPETAAHTHPVAVGDTVATVTDGGSLAFGCGDDVVRADANPIPDARPVAAAGTVAVLTDPTESYDHGVLGDAVEATSLSVVSTDGERRARFAAPEGTVLEGIAPIAADVDGDGDGEYVTTASDGTDGARVVAFDGSGSHYVAPAVGSGYRWRHPLAVAPFGPDGDVEIAVVKTPHIGGVAEFYRATDDGRLALVAESAGNYATHTIGSRNLDAALGGRFADGDWCLLVPDDARERLFSLRRRDDGVERTATLALGGELTSNVSGVAVGDDAHVAAGVGSELVVWTP
ncbi:hypothetical protein [Halogeometricum limi]|uniref:FG-GAP repeat-containing protein n=1 Tax=Halogeometricum limi TaxID=555875 RepID=A0A1I6GSH9_9EURY|nr:hypothetical protein [Halogeometricum limi]SFR45162.1 hypothetical protein SAMN04488124_1477 [Halogeometricum limi]